MGIIIGLLFFLYPSLIEAQRGEWRTHGQYQYYVSPGSMSKSFDKAQTYCNNQEGELALVKTRSIQEFIQTLVPGGSGVPYGFYIGLRDIHSNGTFVWTDGEPLNYKNWNIGEPNNIGSETCITLGWQYTYYRNLPWYDQICVIGSTGPKGFVCQKSAPTTTATTSFEQSTGLTSVDSTAATTNYEQSTALRVSTEKINKSNFLTTSLSTLSSASQTSVQSTSTEGETTEITNAETSSASLDILTIAVASAGGLTFIVLIIIAVSCLVKYRKKKRVAMKLEQSQMEDMNMEDEISEKDSGGTSSKSNHTSARHLGVEEEVSYSSLNREEVSLSKHSKKEKKLPEETSTYATMNAVRYESRSMRSRSATPNTLTIREDPIPVVYKETSPKKSKIEKKVTNNRDSTKDSAVYSFPSKSNTRQAHSEENLPPIVDESPYEAMKDGEHVEEKEEMRNPLYVSSIGGDYPPVNGNDVYDTLQQADNFPPEEEAESLYSQLNKKEGSSVRGEPLYEYASDRNRQELNHTFHGGDIYTSVRKKEY